MRLARLEITHVRNLKAVAVDLADGLNLFYGANGAGKTSILEAVHLLARGRSFRTHRIGSVITRGEEALWVFAQLEDERRGKTGVGFHKRRDNVAEIRVNGVPERRVSTVAAVLPLQVLLPDGADLVLGHPGERRRFLDWGMFHVEHGSLALLRDYQRALRQRNVILRAARGREDSLGRDIDTWDEGLIALAVRVDEMRRHYVSALTPVFDAQLTALSGDLAVELKYLSGWADGVPYEKSLRDSRARDVKSGSTHPGPHRADLRLRAGGQAAAETLSRGQAKVVASALRLAQAEQIATVAGRSSVFLMDDVGAELDRAHNERFFGVLSRMGCQVLATGTAPLRLEGHFQGRQQMFHVEHGGCSADL
ncbi:MAG: DNA replication/repair protein RecF [Gammaproteobacteria bacterium]|nr:DNA replication/repair protein RecF [Gammaproteobacteria bacterium]